MKDEMEALAKENYELNRKLSMIETKCKEAIRFNWNTKYLAIAILKIMGVETNEKK